MGHLCVESLSKADSGRAKQPSDLLSVVMDLRNGYWHNTLERMAVADPGFPIGGVPTRWGGADLQRVHFLAKMYVKTKEIDPVGGAHRRRPPGSANGWY